MTANNKKLNMESLNSLSAAEFKRTLGEIFEHSPWVAEQSYDEKPFQDFEHLHNTMVAAVKRASEHEQLQLLRAHPELTGRFSPEALTEHSSNEQSQAGLTQCSPEQLQLLTEYNQRYRNRFDFPFIVAVKGMDVDGIIAMLKRRVENSEEEEFLEALEQVYRIAEFRLKELVVGC